MRKIFLHILVSLDGFIDDRDGGLDWHLVDDEFDAYINTMLGSIGGMIFGRKAFELLAAYWPAAAQSPGSPKAHVEAARLMHALPKYALSRTLTHTDWHNSHIIGRDLINEVAALKRQPGKDIALFAGGSAATSFAELGLIDEFRLLVHPVLLGGGTPLFQGGYAAAKLKLAQTRTFASGAVLLTYRKA